MGVAEQCVGTQGQCDRPQTQEVETGGWAMDRARKLVTVSHPSTSGEIPKHRPLRTLRPVRRIETLEEGNPGPTRKPVQVNGGSNIDQTPKRDKNGNGGRCPGK